MKIAISQPTYLPWLGYFDLMRQVDLFVFLDSVQFEKQSWQQRNRIKTPTGLQWLTVPVIYRHRFGQKICDVEIREGAFVNKHLRAIELNYRRSRYFDIYFPEITKLLDPFRSGGLLVDLNLALTQWLQKVLGIATPTMLSSKLRVEGQRSQLLVNICRMLEADLYISPRGSAEYLLRDLHLFEAAQIEVKFQNYSHPEYPQSFPPFCAQASVLDLIFNQGQESLELISRGSGRLDPVEMKVDAVPA